MTACNLRSMEICATSRTLLSIPPAMRAQLSPVATDEGQLVGYNIVYGDSKIPECQLRSAQYPQS